MILACLREDPAQRPTAQQLMERLGEGQEAPRRGSRAPSPARRVAPDPPRAIQVKPPAAASPFANA